MLVGAGCASSHLTGSFEEPLPHPSPLRGGVSEEGSAKPRLPVCAEEIAPGGCDGRLPRLVRNLLRVDGADAAVTEAHDDRVAEIARPGPAAHPAAAHVGFRVVGTAATVECPLEETTVHPAGAAVARNVLALLEV